MRKDIKKVAKRTIAPCKWNASLMVETGNVDDIIEVIRQADILSVGDTYKFVKNLQGTDHLQTLRNVYTFVRDNVRYVRDPDDEEIIKTPGCTIAEGKADCKSMTILVGSMLRDLGYTFFYRVAFYDKKEPQQGHIYAVAKVDGKEVVVDPVHHEFNKEVKPWQIRDYQPSAPSLGALPVIPNKELDLMAPGKGIAAQATIPVIALLGLIIFLYD